MADRETALVHLPLQVLSDDPALKSGHEVVVVDPQDLVHLRRVQRYYGPALGLWTLNGQSDAGPAAKGDDDHVELVGELHELHDMVVAL